MDKWQKKLDKIIKLYNLGAYVRSPEQMEEINKLRAEQKYKDHVFFYRIVAADVNGGYPNTHTDEDFATNGQEILDVVDRMSKQYPRPVYDVHVELCERVVKS